MGFATPMSPGKATAGIVQLKTDINVLLLAIPASFDIIGSSLMNVALTLIPASIYQMMRGMIIIVTTVMSIIFLKKKYYRHHWASVATIFIGVAIVGASPLIRGGSSGGEKVNPLGILLLIVAQLFSGGLYIVEEKLLGDYYLDPLKVVGWEGVWGFIMCLIILPIFQQINCGPNALCYYGKLEDTPLAFDEMNIHKVIILYSVLICFSIASFNAFGVAVTKNASSAQRSTIDTSRTVIIWVVQLILGAETFDWLQLVGFILLVCGTLVYNEIVVIPYFGFNQNTKAARARREKEEGMLDGNNAEADNPTYQAISPHAGYDASRNKRKVQEKLDEMQKAKYEIGLNKSELTLDENYGRVNPSVPVQNAYEE